jgi:hypothetical protein
MDRRSPVELVGRSPEAAEAKRSRGMKLRTDVPEAYSFATAVGPVLQSHSTKQKRDRSEVVKES